jgi:hypothetical protein
MPTHPLARISLTPELCRQVGELVEKFRPDWPAHVTASILSSHPHAEALPTAVAALRAAGNPDLPHPRSIMWKGKHWSGLEGALPEPVRPLERCDVCGLTEDRCLTAPGRSSDDHAFTPRR